MWIFLENTNKYFNQFANKLIILVAFKMQPVCNQFIQVGFFVYMNNL